MADTTENEAKISIKVIVDKVNSRVVYAEADYTFVDILFSFITLPMGTSVRLLRKQDDKMFKALGSLNNLYQSLEDFPEYYLSTKKCKDLLLNPTSLAYEHCKDLKLKIDDTIRVHYLNCSFCPFLSYCNRVLPCPSGFLDEVPIVSCDGVFVSDIANFIITDELCVEPYSSASSIRLLAELGITDMNQLEERNLEMSSYQMLSFLNMALTTNCPLTYFLFSKINPIRPFVVSGQHNTFDQSCDLLKKEVSASSRMVVEVTRQKSTKRLLFAESKEDFVEFLFGILSIPLGTVVGTLMNVASSVSCMDNIFKSVSNMSGLSMLKAMLRSSSTLTDSLEFQLKK